MGFPNNLLSEGEEVALHMHPHWKELIAPVLWFVLVAVLGSVAFFLMPESAETWVTIAKIAIVALTVIVIVWVSVIPWISWSSTHYVFTTHRVLLRTGVITRKGRDIPYARINDVSFEQTVAQRMFRLGTLMIQSASEQGAVIFNDMPKVEMVQSTLYKLVEEDRNRRFQGEDDPGI
ncbi:MAG TPA: PH domain-containing protein [Candidatus Stackebrandtia faecavium]|nr:PH domain-containing protein [Candidatus Stackebrandtia faecavium]